MINRGSVIKGRRRLDRVEEKGSEELNHHRPQNLAEFVGKKQIVQSIKKALEVAKLGAKPVEHMLFYGPPGVGKTSLAHLIANEMGSNIKIVQSTNIQNIADLLSVLSAVKELDVLFIDEIHNLKPKLAELLYQPLEDCVIDLIIGKSYNSKLIRLPMPKFTMIGATTNLGALPKALEERFGYHFFVDIYTDEEMSDFVCRHVESMEIKLKEGWLVDIVQNSRGIPRNCRRILRRVKDYQSLGLDLQLNEILRECGYIYQGITEIDYKYLGYLGENRDRVLGIKTLVQGCGIDERTVLTKIEPFLIKRGLIVKLRNGRKLTKSGMIFLDECKRNWV